MSENKATDELRKQLGYLKLNFIQKHFEELASQAAQRLRPAIDCQGLHRWRGHSRLDQGAVGRPATRSDNEIGVIARQYRRGADQQHQQHLESTAGTLAGQRLTRQGHRMDGQAKRFSGVSHGVAPSAV